MTNLPFHRQHLKRGYHGKIHHRMQLVLLRQFVHYSSVSSTPQQDTPHKLARWIHLKTQPPVEQHWVSRGISIFAPRLFCSTYRKRYTRDLRELARTLVVFFEKFSLGPIPALNDDFISFGIAHRLGIKGFCAIVNADGIAASKSPFLAPSQTRKRAVFKWYGMRNSKWEIKFKSRGQATC